MTPEGRIRAALEPKSSEANLATKEMAPPPGTGLTLSGELDGVNAGTFEPASR